MTNEVAKTQQKGAFLTNPQLITAGIARKYFDPQNKASDEELAYFVAICHERNLNPFTKEAYFIKYGTSPAQIVVSKDAFMKRAEMNPAFDGFEAGIVIETADSEIKYIKGTIKPSQAKLLGGWAKVYRKDRSYPIEVDADFESYNTNKSMWAKMPALMIRKVALVSAMREAFSENVGGLYTSDEMEQSVPVDVTPKESRQEVMGRKQAQIEEWKKQKELETLPESAAGSQSDFKDNSDDLADQDLKSPTEADKGSDDIAEEVSLFEGDTTKVKDFKG